MTTPPRYKWAERWEEAALLVARDDLTNEGIARYIGVSRYCLDKWKRRPQFQQRVAEITAAMATAIKAKGIADLQNRVAALNERWNLLRKVIETRAVQYAGVPGGDTGLLICRFRLARTRGQCSLAKRQIAAGQLGLWEGDPEREGGGEDAAPMEVREYVLDVGLLRELREHEKLAARELGRWSAGRDTVPAAVVTEYVGVPVGDGEGEAPGEPPVPYRHGGSSGRDAAPARATCAPPDRGDA